MDENELAMEILHKMVLWVPKEDRELMIAELARELGAEAGGIVEDRYKVHAINGNG